MAANIPTLTGAQLAQRMLANFPNPWTGDAAKAPGGVAYAFFEAVGNEQEILLDGVLAVQAELYTLQQTLPQLALINQSAATRGALQAAVQKITGVAPRMIEPWAPADTGAWNAGVSYWDVDTPANPAQWADPSLKWTGFMISVFGPSDIGSVTGGWPLQTWDDAAYWNVPGYGLLSLPVNPNISVVLSILQQLHAEGTRIFIRFVPSLPIFT